MNFRPYTVSFEPILSQGAMLSARFANAAKKKQPADLKGQRRMGR